MALSPAAGSTGDNLSSPIVTTEAIVSSQDGNTTPTHPDPVHLRSWLINCNLFSNMLFIDFSLRPLKALTFVRIGSRMP